MSEFKSPAQSWSMSELVNVRAAECPTSSPDAPYLSSGVCALLHSHLAQLHSPHLHASNSHISVPVLVLLPSPSTFCLRLCLISPSGHVRAGPASRMDDACGHTGLHSEVTLV